MKGYGRGPASSKDFQKGTLEYRLAEERLKKEIEEEEKKRKAAKKLRRAENIQNTIVGSSNPFRGRSFEVE